MSDQDCAASSAGVPEKYSREVTDHYLDRLDGRLPSLDEFADDLAPGA